jgi:Domain of unknown function (DUF6458)
MTVGTSVTLIALGAILKYAVTATVAGIDLQVAGVVLIAMGVLGLLLTLLVLVVDRRHARRLPPPSH